MIESNSAAEEWELGCRRDEVRNGFVIPELVRIISAVKPATILDVGAGTGYIAREINHRLGYSPIWTLVDTDPERVALAKAYFADTMVQEVLENDVMSLPDTPRYDAVLVTFTLLEVQDVAGCVAKLRRLMTAFSILSVVLPDAWIDVIAAGREDPSVIEKFLGERVSIPKNDKFTGKPYPFEAVRNEALIDIVLRAGFVLVEIAKSSPPSPGIFMLTFRRTT
jgi:SAM-dependent methyltransferase